MTTGWPVRPLIFWILGFLELKRDTLGFCKYNLANRVKVGLLEVIKVKLYFLANSKPLTCFYMDELLFFVLRWEI